MWNPFRARRLRLEQEAQLARDERNLERQHQLQLLSTFLNTLQTIQDSSTQESSKNAEGLIAVATSMSEQAKGFAEWMSLFRTTTAPTTSVISEEDEYVAEQKALLNKGLPADFEALPEEFKLAWVLKNDPNQLADDKLSG